MNFFSCIPFVYYDSTVFPYYNKSISFQKEKINKKIKLIILPVKRDNLSDWRIGIKKNGYGFKTANVYSDLPPEILLKRAILKEFNSIGIDVNDNYHDHIQIIINKLFVEPNGLFSEHLVAIFDIEVLVTFEKETYKRRFKGIGTSYAPLRIGIFYEIAIEDSLHNLLSKFIPEFYSLIKSKKSDTAGDAR